jgi:hypothetical protein
VSYATAFKDHSYLWNEYAPAEDMTGGYEDSRDLDKLLAKPSKATAEKCLESQIVYWFQSGPDSFDCPDGINWDDPEIVEIGERYGQRQGDILVK